MGDAPRGERSIRFTPYDHVYSEGYPNDTCHPGRPLRLVGIQYPVVFPPPLLAASFVIDASSSGPSPDRYGGICKCEERGWRHMVAHPFSLAGPAHELGDRIPDRCRSWSNFGTHRSSVLPGRSFFPIVVEVG